MNLKVSHSKLTSSLALEKDLYHARAENESLTNQLNQLQTELRKRENSVYDLVNRTKELAEKLNDKTTENSRLNRKLLASLTAQSDIKSRFIESLKKLKECRFMLRLSFDVSVKIRNALDGVISSFDSGELYDLSKLQNLNRKLRNNDFKFTLGAQDHTAALNMLEKSELRNLDQLTKIYESTFGKLKPIQISKFQLPNLNSPDVESSIQNSKNDSMSINISLLKNYIHAPKAKTTPSCFQQFDLNTQRRKKKCLDSPLNMKEGTLSVNESDEASIENQLGTTKFESEISPIEHQMTSKPTTEGITEGFGFLSSMAMPGILSPKKMLMIEESQVHSQGDLAHKAFLRREIRSPVLSYKFLNDGTALSYLFSNKVVI